MLTDYGLADPVDEAGFLEGLAAYRARIQTTVTPAQHQPTSRKTTGGK